MLAHDSSSLLRQDHAHERAGSVGHEQGDVQDAIIEFQIVQGKAHSELCLLWIRLCVFLQASALDVRFRLDLDGDDVVLALDDEVDFIRRIGAGPVAGHDVQLWDERLQDEVLGQCALEFHKKTLTPSRSAASDRETPSKPQAASSPISPC